MRDTYESFVVAVATLRGTDHGAACDYVRAKVDLAVDVVCAFPELRRVIAELGERLHALNTDVSSLSADMSSLSTRVQALEARQRAEGRAIVEIIHLISPSFSDADQAKFDDIITEMERPLHTVERR